VRHNRDIDKYVPTWYYDHRKQDVPPAGMVTQVHLPYGRTAELRSATLRANPMTIYKERYCNPRWGRGVAVFWQPRNGDSLRAVIVAENPRFMASAESHLPILRPFLRLDAKVLRVPMRMLRTLELESSRTINAIKAVHNETTDPDRARTIQDYLDVPPGLDNIFKWRGAASRNRSAAQRWAS